MKRIIICCDGTWQSVFNDKPPSNIEHITRLLLSETSDGIQQIVYYDAGIGADHGKYNGGLTGKGINLNIMQSYQFIVDNYVEGDELYFFGFSRGAYTVRSLAGMLCFTGVLEKNSRQTNDITEAFREYQSRDETQKQTTLFADRTRFVSIDFLGVFDTVSALGMQGHVIKADPEAYAFHNNLIGCRITKARHALALDEHRAPFSPEVWQLEQSANTDSQQVWFVGDHADIGGGHEINETGLSNITLSWMLEESGLAYNDQSLNEHHQPNVMGPIHDQIPGSVSYRYTGEYLRHACRTTDGSHMQLPIGQQGYGARSVFKPGTSWAGMFKPSNWRAPVSWYHTPSLCTRNDVSLHPTVIERLQKDSDYKPKALFADTTKAQLIEELGIENQSAQAQRISSL